MPEIRPFRALRYDPETVGDLGAVVAPPYDVIGADEHERAAGAPPAPTSSGSTCPRDEPGDEPDDRYRRAARTLAAWRSDGTLRKDPHPSIYVYEQTYRVPGTDVERTQRGFFARLRLEPFGPERGVLPHERTLAGPAEDRYRLLRATGVNTSPVVGLYDDPSGAGRPRPRRARPRGAADVDVDRRRRRPPPAVGGRRPTATRRPTVAPLLAAAAARAGDDRRRPPPLRDGAALPRRATDDAARARRTRRSTTC